MTLDSDPITEPIETVFERNADGSADGDATDVVSWLLQDGPSCEPDSFFPELANRLTNAGVPVDRVFTTVESMHSTYTGYAKTWSRGSSCVVTKRMLHGQRATDLYKMSPFATATETGKWVTVNLTTAPDQLYNIIPELKADGYKHYLCIPIPFSDGRQNGIAFATKDGSGYTGTRRTILQAIMPAFSILLELIVERWRLESTLRTYVGRTPAQKILQGTVRSGEVSRIEAAILFADMRDFTSRTVDMAPEKTVELLDRFFDCIVPAIRENGGEILKFTGDGLLATFAVDSSRPDSRAAVDNDDTGSSATDALATGGALKASQEALACVHALEIDGEAPFDAGFALHFGEAAYGNVGSEDRLDFTVVGRDINLCSRIARLNKPLGEPILISDEFRTRGDIAAAERGLHSVAGISEPVAVYRPDVTA